MNQVSQEQLIGGFGLIGGVMSVSGWCFKMVGGRLTPYVFHAMKCQNGWDIVACKWVDGERAL